CGVGECERLELVLVEAPVESHRWREQIERYHYLGCPVPFGAHLRYWVRTQDRELACLLWTSPAWKMQARDEWIGWSDEQRRGNLQRIVNNGRFLILPWVRVQGLASKILALGTRQCARLGKPVWSSSTAAGNVGGHGAFPPGLLPCCQLDPCRTNRRTRSYGPGAQSSRSSRQRHLRLSAGPRRPAVVMRRSRAVNKYIQLWKSGASS